MWARFMNLGMTFRTWDCCISLWSVIITECLKAAEIIDISIVIPTSMIELSVRSVEVDRERGVREWLRVSDG
jgi:hypothetical protein